MFVHPNFDPIAFTIGPVTLPWFGPKALSVRWYGIMYLVGFITALLLGKHRAKTRPDLGWTTQQVDDALLYIVLGVVLGGRLGYVLFYKAGYYFSNPLEILYVWQGGMSFHGGFIGVMLAAVLFARATGKPWLGLMDFIAPLVPPALGAGRFGNFINGELVGRVTDVPWAMIYPQVDMQARHPSQLYNVGLEGIFLFILLWWFSSKPRPRGAVSAMFLLGYGICRFTEEFARAPDDFLGLLALGLSMGQWLSAPMIVAGIVMMIWSYRKT
jgi:phosphatidylglycerol---prolipoprotein diacylglyceryl transferase